VLGFQLMENFRTPYYSLSIGEFWHRWHISLSTWFRDYVYIPLGGSRRGIPRWLLAVLVTFAISGLWHGANWTYVVWGALNGVYLLFGSATKDFRNRIFAVIGLREETLPRRGIMLATTFFLTCVGWVIFRARNMSDAAYVLTHFASGWNFHHIGTEQFLLRQMPIAVAAILGLEVGQLWHGRIPVPSIVGRLSLAPRWMVYASFVLAVIMFGVYRNSQFIYFQF
jgi:alginate O-acetyltransferase complex protein AlgI